MLVWGKPITVESAQCRRISERSPQKRHLALSPEGASNTRSNEGVHIAQDYRPSNIPQVTGPAQILAWTQARAEQPANQPESANSNTNIREGRRYLRSHLLHHSFAPAAPGLRNRSIQYSARRRSLSGSRIGSPAIWCGASTDRKGTRFQVPQLRLAITRATFVPAIAQGACRTSLIQGLCPRFGGYSQPGPPGRTDPHLRLLRFT